MKIIITDDSSAYREGLKYFLNKLGGFEVIGEYCDGEELLQSTEIIDADILLLDIVMPKIDGFKAAKQLVIKYPKIKIIAVTMFQEETYLRDLIQTGFKGCVFKLNIYDELPRAISTVMNGKLFFPENMLIEH